VLSVHVELNWTELSYLQQVDPLARYIIGHASASRSLDSQAVADSRRAESWQKYPQSRRNFFTASRKTTRKKQAVKPRHKILG